MFRCDRFTVDVNKRWGRGRGKLFIDGLLGALTFDLLASECSAFPLEERGPRTATLERCAPRRFTSA